MFVRRMVAVALMAALVAPALVRAEAPSTDDAAVARTRKTVKMLDDLYKTAVVLITTHYVTEESSLPAGTAAIALFDAMEKKGWHQVRLVDATGQPIEEKNAPRDDFEKKSIAKLLAGETFVETVEGAGADRHLRVATPVPVVLEKCVMCHDHYQQAKPGQPIGALVYRLKVE